MTKKTTCVEPFCDAISRYERDSDPFWAFIRGYVYGQAEKVMLGACTAAMFRPATDNLLKLAAIVDDVITPLGLVPTVIVCPNGAEVWISRPQKQHLVRMLFNMERDSDVWHAWRASLCGVPNEEIDVRFHERPGYGRHP